jgi:transposase
MTANGSLCENSYGHLKIKKGTRHTSRIRLTYVAIPSFSYASHSNPCPELLLFPNLEEFIEKDNVVRVVDAIVDSLDLQAIGFEKVTAKREGRPCFHPAMMLKLYLYGYMNSIGSSRKLEGNAKEI